MAPSIPSPTFRVTAPVSPSVADVFTKLTRNFNWLKLAIAEIPAINTSRRATANGDVAANSWGHTTIGRTATAIVGAASNALSRTDKGKMLKVAAKRNEEKI